tara:strand:+ start:90 stop:2165 length:2076 start_codon:yes stop_codon:yes gene_type:complete
MLINDQALLFCLDKDEPTLDLSETQINRSNLQIELDNFFQSISGYTIESWLTAATEDDHSGDIYLNRIYRVTFNNINRENLSSIKTELASFPFIYHVEYDYLRVPFYQPNDTRYNQQWSLPKIQSDHAWDFWDVNGGDNPGSQDILLASVDTGVDWNHSDLIDNIWQNLGEDADGDGRTLEYINGEWVFDPGDLNNIDDDDWDNNANTYIDDLIGWDPAGINGMDDNDPMPPYNWAWHHGTHVAGLLGATTDNNKGVASSCFDCSILSVKVSDENQGNDVYITDGYDGILYAAKVGFYRTDRGFSIINNSWGGLYYNIFEQSVIDVAYNDYNAIIVAAAGNDHIDAAHYPSSYEHVISVTATNSQERVNWATYHETVDLASPGEGITSTVMQNNPNNENNAYDSWSGTSMASPVAASVIGLLSSFNPDWGQVQLETMILATSDPVIYDINSNYLDGKIGEGRVDALRALSTPLFPKIELAEIDYYVIDGDDAAIDPGETVHLTTILFNDIEWGEALSPSITLNSLSEYFEISNSTQDTDNLSPGDIYLNIESPFEITVSENIPTGVYDFELMISSNDTEYASYEVKDTISLEVNGNLFTEVIVPSNFTVLDAYPNPFNPSCTLAWETPQGGDLLIEVYDLNGSKLTTLVDSYYLAGKHQFIWNASNFSNGMYFILYSFKDYSHTQKITLLK